MAVMALELKTWCFGCLLTHGVNAGLAIVTVASFLVGGTPKPGPAYPAPRLAAAALFAGFALFLLNISFVQLGRVMGAVGILQGELLKITEDAEYIRIKYEREPSVSIPLRDDEPWFGDVDAPNTLVAFADFQCAICRKAAEIITDAVRQHPGRMRVTYRHFPQDSDCNAHYPTRAHPAACAAARAAEAALTAGGADAYHRMRSLLYERQRDLELNRYEEWASELGLDAAAFAAALGSDEVKNKVKAHAELGGKLGVTAVPVLYLNGKRLKLWQSPAIWDALLSDAPTTQPAAP
jgi:protein-disulfide isomerase